VSTATTTTAGETKKTLLHFSVSLLSILLAGILFGLGLTVSGMINPAKVIGFLDLSGNWDPSLMLVLGGGLLVTIPSYHLILKRDTPLLEPRFYLPTRKDLDARLLSGAVLFGIGWGIAGLCPGPALTALVTLAPTALLFVFAMIVGMLAHRFIVK